ncbi:hypothetical protein BS78_05G080200 [Paspalum vaginatum]|nr:hypothetical protein BS78_05G080200 [Paspalum vaginatum]
MHLLCLVHGSQQPVVLALTTPSLTHAQQSRRQTTQFCADSQSRRRTTQSCTDSQSSPDGDGAGRLQTQALDAAPERKSSNVPTAACGGVLLKPDSLDGSTTTLAHIMTSMRAMRARLCPASADPWPWARGAGSVSCGTPGSRGGDAPGGLFHAKLLRRRHGMLPVVGQAAMGGAHWRALMARTPRSAAPPYRK